MATANAYDAMGYLIDRHKKVSERLDAAATPGQFCPGVIEACQAELRGIEKTISEIAVHAR